MDERFGAFSNMMRIQRVMRRAGLGALMLLAPLACDSAENTPDGSGGTASGSAGKGGSAPAGAAGKAGGGSGGAAGTSAASGSGGAAGSGTSGGSGGGGAGASVGDAGAGGASAGDGGGGGASGTGAGNGGASGSAGAAGGDTSACDDSNLVWRTARKTTYTSYPDPNSEECIEYNGCMWAGQFAACNGVKSEEWVAAHNIAAAFPSFDELELHDLCIRQGNTRMIVTVLDTCGDDDCDGCCTRNQGSADQLIDLESYTNARWGLPDAQIEWADLGPTKGGGCE